jgi:CheY-like chemotaxis protein
VKTILLADDSITIQKVVELTFSEGDYQVICVSNGTEALKKIREARPHVALLDIIMPEKNGYEVCEELKKDPATADIPVLLLTGTFEPFDEKRADAVGAVGHLTKPFESHALVSRVDELIAAAGGATEVPAADPVAPTALPETPAADPVMPTALPETPVTPVIATAPSTDAGMEQSPVAAPEVPPPGLAAPSPYTEDVPSGPAPIGTAPDPDEGGSLQASAPFDLGSADEEVVPDRFADPSPPAGDTVRLSRDEVLAASQSEEGSAPVSPADEASQDAPMDGFVSGYEMPEPGSAAPSLQKAVEVQGDATAPTLTQEMVDRIAEQVVQRMSDRAVREIAWEVIPQVAEAIVRNRIKELEEQGEG